MFSSGPPRLGAGEPLQVSAAARRVYDRPSATATDPRLGEFLADLAGAYGLEYHDEPRQAGLGQSFAEMCRPLIEDLVPADEPVDLLVLAFDSHDLRPGQSTSIFLSHVCPGDPLAVTVCDQGTASPFTALRLVRTYARTYGLRRALLLVAEQSVLHYDLPRPADLPARHAAVAIRFDTAAGNEPAPVRQYPAIAPERVAAVLADALAGLDGDGLTLVLGAGLEPADVDPRLAPRLADIVRAPAGQPCTGAWWQLAGGLAEWPGPVVLADYDRALGYLSVAPVTGARRPVAAVGS